MLIPATPPRRWLPPAPILRLVALLALAAGPVAAAEGPTGVPAADPAALVAEIRAASLDPAGAVTVEGLALDLPRARLRIERGVFVPTRPVAGRVAEMVFLGRARFTVEPPDEVEAGQLELHTGVSRLEETVTEATLVLNNPQVVAAVLGDREPAALSSGEAARAQSLFDSWRASPQRSLLDVDGAIAAGLAGDPLHQAYSAVHLRGETLGEMLYVVEPDAHEQITLGQFVPLEATEKERRKIGRELHRQQRRGRLIGLTVDDLGEWRTWMSAPLAGDGGGSLPGHAAYEPKRYRIELALADKDLELSGRARIAVTAATGGSRVVKLRLNPDLEVTEMRGEAGGELPFHRAGAEVAVWLPQVPEQGATLAVEVAWRGRLIDKVEGRTWALRDTQDWYPHAGQIDLAPYELTFRWPEKVDLVASGRRLDDGTGPDGRRWERRVLELPTTGVSFEVGKYRTTTRTFGHVEVTLAADPLSRQIVAGGEEELLATIGDSLTWFETIFGPYPLDELTAVTAPRGFSQAMLGFVTLSTLMMSEDNLLTWLLGLEDPRTVVAHEIAHQWFGHQIGFESYRDAWISEALANYAAVLYARNRLDSVRYGIGPTAGWQEALTRTTDDGRTIESLGPLVLGERLAAGDWPQAHEAIVYKKGAVVLDMLARRFGEERFLAMLKEAAGFVDHRAISTENFLKVLEKLSGVELSAFADQFIYGTGLPEVTYDYTFGPRPDGKWQVSGTARQRSPQRWRYHLVELPGGGFDVARESVGQMAVEGSTLVVPVQIAVYDPEMDRDGGKGRKRGKRTDASETGNRLYEMHVLLSGEETELSAELDHEPKGLWLDHRRVVFGRFFNERRYPKRVLYQRGVDALARGRVGEAEALWVEALAAPPLDGPTVGVEKTDIEAEERFFDTSIRLEQVRLQLDRGERAAARSAFAAAETAADRTVRYRLAGPLALAEARLALHEGDAERAFRLLRKAVLRRGEAEGAEGWLLLAIAARETGRGEEYEEAVAAALERGADLGGLGAPQGR